MNEENVVQMPPPLDRLASKIRTLLTQDAANRHEWIAVQCDFCLTLVEARDKFDADIEFGEWCKRNSFGEEALNHHTRAAAIAMGREPDALRKCLEQTTRRSLQHIYRSEFSRFTQLSKPTAHRRKTKPSPKSDKIRDEVRSRLEEGEPINRKKLGNLFDVGSTTVDRVAERELGRLEGLQEAAVVPLAVPEMAPTMQQRYDAAVRLARKTMREELKAQITAEVHETYDAYIKFYNEQITNAQEIVASYKGIITRADFRKIKACLHPDHNTFAYAVEALQLFSSLEGVLVKADQPAARTRLPSSAVDLLARRKAWR